MLVARLEAIPDRELGQRNKWRKEVNRSMVEIDIHNLLSDGIAGQVILEHSIYRRSTSISTMPNKF